MTRLILLLSVLVTLCICCPIVTATDGVDAFAAMTSNIPPQADPATRSFLQNIAKQLKRDRHIEAVSNAPVVRVNFAIDSKDAWHIRPSYRKDKAQTRATKLTEKTLRGLNPPNNQPMVVTFIFDMWPTTLPDVISSKVVSSTPQVISQRDVDFGPYMFRLQEKVKSNWVLDKAPQKDAKTVVVFTVKKDGSINDVHLATKSSSSEHDNAALRAISNSAPFLPLPPGAPDDVDIQYTFEYHVRFKWKNNNAAKLFTIHLAEPDVVTVESVVSKNSGHFKTF